MMALFLRLGLLMRVAMCVRVGVRVEMYVGPNMSAYVYMCVPLSM